MSVSSVIWSKITPSQLTLTSEQRRKGGNLFFMPNFVRRVYNPDVANGVDVCNTKYPQSNPFLPSQEYTTCLDNNTNRGQTVGVVANTLLAPDNSNTRRLFSNRPRYGGRRSKKNKQSKRKGGKSRKARK